MSPSTQRLLGAFSVKGRTPFHRLWLASALVLALAAGTIGLVAAISAAQAVYFPGFSDLRNQWYSQSLHAMGEPVLDAGGGDRSYRFLWLRSFHNPVAVRIESLDGKHRLVAVELDAADGRPGRVQRRTEIVLSREQFADVERLVADSGFWTMAPTERSGGRDGAQWIIEGATDRYHAVDRWSPTSGAVRRIGTGFLALAGWTFEDREVY